MRPVSLQKRKFRGHLTLMHNRKLSRIERPSSTVPMTHERRLTQTATRVICLNSHLSLKKKKITIKSGFSERCLCLSKPVHYVAAAQRISTAAVHEVKSS